MRVLVVEDDTGLGELIEEALAEDGHEAEWTGDGCLAVRLAAETLPDVILLDYLMPECSAPEVAEALRAEPRTAGIPLVLMTGAVRPEAKMREVGAAALILKPFDVFAIAPVLLRVVASGTSMLAAAC